MAHIVYVNHPLKKSASLLLLAAFSGVGACCGIASAQSFDVIVPPPQFAPGSSVRGLSADGTRATGAVSSPDGTSAFSFIWSRSEGLRVLQNEGLPQGFQSTGISGDGQVVTAGNRFVSNPLRWSSASGTQTLQIPSTYNRSFTTSLNHDGSIAVGYSQRFVQGPFPFYTATLWGPDGSATLLGTTRGGTSQATAISRDGSTVVGVSDAGVEDAFVWTATGGIRILPSRLGDASGHSQAYGVSNHGDYIVGQSNDLAVVWHNNTVTTLTLPDGTAYRTAALSVSDDGRVIGGAAPISGPSSAQVAAVWTPETKFIPLTDYLASFGVAVPTGVVPNYISYISADGRTFAGQTTDGYAFVASIPSPGGMMVLVGPILLATRRRRA